MKVLHVIPSVEPNSGGPAEAIFPMCRALQAQGVDVLLSTTSAGLAVEAENTVVDHIGVRTIFFPSQLGDSFKFSRPMSVWLNDHVKDFDVVHIHAVFNHASVAAARACRKQGVPYVVRPLGTLAPWSMKQKRLRKQLFWQLEGQNMLRNASAVHYTTSAERDECEHSLGLSNGAVIHLGSDSDVSLAETDEPLLPQLNDQPYVLVLSRLHPKKAINVLIDAFIDVTNSTFARWQLVIAGSGPEEHVSSLRSQVENARAQNRILFPGWLDRRNKWTVLKRASLLALPSYQENFGLCVLEALTCGVPVIVSPQVNLAADILNADAGWVVPIDRAQLAAALTEAFSSQGLRLRKGEAGKMLSAKFAWPEIANQLVELYSSIGMKRGVARKAVA